jgi:hypothetical protein
VTLANLRAELDDTRDGLDDFERELRGLREALVETYRDGAA